jgi:glycogen synthase
MNLRAMTWNLTVQKLFFSQEKDLVFYKQLSTYIKINYYEKDIVISVCYPNARELQWIINEHGFSCITMYRLYEPVLGMHVNANAWEC